MRVPCEHALFTDVQCVVLISGDLAMVPTPVLLLVMRAPRGLPLAVRVRKRRIDGAGRSMEHLLRVAKVVHAGLLLVA